MKATPLIIAHRGASRHAPENTLAAFRAAIDAHSDGVEFDVQLSKDGVPVVIHDHTLERTGSRPGRVSALTAKQLGLVDAGSWFNARHPKRARAAFTREKIPTLAEVLGLLKEFGGRIYIELKPNRKDHRELVRAVCDLVRSSPLLPQIIIKSFKLATIPEVRRFLPAVQTGALFAPQIMDFLRRRKHIITIAREFGADHISLHYSLVTPKLISLATAARLPVTIWTTDRSKWVERSRKLGVTALITNDPGKLLATGAREGNRIG